MVVYQKDGKTCEGSPLSALQAYNQIISLLFSYYFPSCSLLFPYFSPIVPYYVPIFPYCSLLFPCFSPIVPGETWRNHILSVENLLNISKLKKLTGAEFFDDVFASF